MLLVFLCKEPFNKGSLKTTLKEGRNGILGADAERSGEAMRARGGLGGGREKGGSNLVLRIMMSSMDLKCAAVAWGKDGALPGCECGRGGRSEWSVCKEDETHAGGNLRASRSGLQSLNREMAVELVSFSSPE